MDPVITSRGGPPVEPRDTSDTEVDFEDPLFDFLFGEDDAVEDEGFSPGHQVA
jgi:hypothetical protein